jgi:hypothetical protein
VSGGRIASRHELHDERSALTSAAFDGESLALFGLFSAVTVRIVDSDASHRL